MSASLEWAASGVVCPFVPSTASRDLASTRSCTKTASHLAVLRMPCTHTSVCECGSERDQRRKEMGMADVESRTCYATAEKHASRERALEPNVYLMIPTDSGCATHQFQAAATACPRSGTAPFACRETGEVLARFSCPPSRSSVYLPTLAWLNRYSSSVVRLWCYCTRLLPRTCFVRGRENLQAHPNTIFQQTQPLCIFLAVSKGTIGARWFCHDDRVAPDTYCCSGVEELVWCSSECCGGTPSGQYASANGAGSRIPKTAVPTINFGGSFCCFNALR